MDQIDDFRRELDARRQRGEREVITREDDTQVEYPVIRIEIQFSDGERSWVQGIRIGRRSVADLKRKLNALMTALARTIFERTDQWED